MQYHAVKKEAIYKEFSTDDKGLSISEVKTRLRRYGKNVLEKTHKLKPLKILLDELRTNKRSELLKKHSELKNIVKHLPKKYQKLLKDKEEELSIR